MGHRKTISDLLGQANSCRDEADAEAFFRDFEAEFNRLMGKLGRYIVTDYETGFHGYDIFRCQANITACLAYKVVLDDDYETHIGYEMMAGEFSAVITTYHVEPGPERKRYHLMRNFQEKIECDSSLPVDDLLEATVTTALAHQQVILPHLPALADSASFGLL